MKILVAALGNPILGDDGVGWRVGQLAQQDYKSSNLHNENRNVDFGFFSLGGLSLMEQMVGYDFVVLIDSFTSQNDQPGTIINLPLEKVIDTQSGHMAAAHDTSITTALKMGELLGAAIPKQIQVIGIETSANFEFSEELTPTIAAIVPQASAIVIDQVNLFYESEAIV